MQVAPRQAEHHRQAGGARGGDEPLHVFEGNGQERVGILLAQVGLLQEGQVFEGVRRGKVAGRHADAGEMLAPLRAVLQALAQSGQPLALDLEDAVSVQQFYLRVKHVSLLLWAGWC
ncbi:Uncharacterised protein [Bordetella pertussis]|nr:Uncharacterised protein [Bordetella pertussis]